MSIDAEVSTSEALHNLIVLARPHFSDSTQMLALHHAEQALAALRSAPEPVAVEAGLAERLQDLERHLLAEAQHTSGRKAVTVAYARAEAAAIAAASLASLQAQVDALTAKEWIAYERLNLAEAKVETLTRERLGYAEALSDAIIEKNDEITRLRQRVEEQDATEDQVFLTLEDAYTSALAAAIVFYDAASNEEANWTGWGDQVVPFSAEMRRVKARQALSALRDADPRRARTKEPNNV